MNTKTFRDLLTRNRRATFRRDTSTIIPDLLRIRNSHNNILPGHQKLAKSNVTQTRSNPFNDAEDSRFPCQSPTGLHSISLTEQSVLIRQAFRIDL